MREKIASSCCAAGLFTLMVDGTTDKNGREMEAIALRYFYNDKIEERVIDFVAVDDRSAKGLMDAVQEVLNTWKISWDGIVSNTFDGAYVMSGHKGM